MNRWSPQQRGPGGHGSLLPRCPSRRRLISESPAAASEDVRSTPQVPIIETGRNQPATRAPFVADLFEDDLHGPGRPGFRPAWLAQYKRGAMVSDIPWPCAQADHGCYPRRQAMPMTIHRPWHSRRHACRAVDDLAAGRQGQQGRAARGDCCRYDRGSGWTRPSSTTHIHLEAGKRWADNSQWFRAPLGRHIFFHLETRGNTDGMELAYYEISCLFWPASRRRVSTIREPGPHSGATC